MHPFYHERVHCIKIAVFSQRKIGTFEKSEVPIFCCFKVKYSYRTATPQKHDFFILYHKVLGSIILFSCLLFYN